MGTGPENVVSVVLQGCQATPPVVQPCNSALATEGCLVITREERFVSQCV